MDLYTIGFTQKSAEEFFGLLTGHHIERLIDIRIHPDGQLAGFAKRQDLAYFLNVIAGIEYHYFDFLAPSEELLKGYKVEKDWAAYEKRYLALIKERKILERLDPKFFQEKHCCFLCSEHLPEKCHRRLLVEYLAGEWEDVKIFHL